MEKRAEKRCSLTAILRKIYRDEEDYLRGPPSQVACLFVFVLIVTVSAMMHGLERKMEDVDEFCFFLSFVLFQL